MKNILFFLSFTFSILASQQSFAQWSPVNNGLKYSYVYSIAISGQNIFTAVSNRTSKSGIFLSTNNGSNWVEKDSGIANNEVIDRFAINGDNIFAGVGYEFDSYSSAGIYLSTNNGNNWNAPDSGINHQGCCGYTNISSFAINTPYIFAGSYGGVYLSSNNGKYWNTVNNGLTESNVLSLAVSGTNIFAGGQVVGNQGWLFLSTNNGTKWSAVNNNSDNNWINSGGVTCLTISGTNVFAGTAIEGIFLSTDNGTNWNAINNGLNTNNIIWCIVKNSEYLYTGTSNGIFLSTNNGNSWIAVNGGLTNLALEVNSIAISGNYVFAGTSDGVYISELGSTKCVMTSYSVTGGGNICQDSTGLEIGLNGSDIGVNYQLELNDKDFDTVFAGTGSAINFGKQTNAGTYTVIATNPITTCSLKMADSATITINKLPIVYNVTGGGSFCTGGSGVFVGLNGSQKGVNYQLQLNGENWRTSIAGTGTALNFGNQTNAGSYTVIATNPTTTCSNNMNGNAIISVSQSPTLSSSLTPPAICSNTTFNYVPTSTTTGTTFNWSRVTVAGISNSAATGIGNPSETLINITAAPVNVTYVYTLAANGCTNPLAYNVVVTVNPTPILTSTLAPPSICSNTVFNYMPNSTTAGTTFNWSRAAVAGISNVANTGSNNPNEILINTINFPVNVTYVYNVAANGCTNPATYNVVVTVNPVPLTYAVTGGGTYPTGGIGVPVGLSGSQTGVDYELYLNNVSTGYTISGTGAAISFGNQTAQGIYTVIATNLSGCSNNMTGTATVIITTCPRQAPTAIGASRCGTGSVTLQASGGKTYLWYNAASGGNVVNVGPTFNTPALKIPTTYYVSNFDSCESARTPVLAQINTLSISTGGDQTISCGNSIALNTTTNYNGNQNLTYSWTPYTGLSSSSSENPIASPLQTTNYTVMVSDGNCSAYDNVTVYVNTIDFNLNFTTNVQLIYVPPFAVQFNNLTPDLNSYDFTWYFGDGASEQSNNSVVFHQYAQNGTYDITLIAKSISTGCMDTLFKQGWIFCAGGTTCSQTASISQTSPISGCGGTSVMLTCNTVSGATYQWNYNGVAIENSNNTTYYANATGNYSVTIIVNNCPVTSGIVSVLLNNPPTAPAITSSGNLTYCGGGSETLSTTAVASSYLWSNGGTGQSIIVNTPGEYTLRITDNNGCTTQSLPFLVGTSPIANPDICIVTVDATTGKNKIVWNKPSTTAINHFNIYSQGAQANIFNLIGKVQYSSLSVFVDNASVPAQQSYLYEISAVDTCGSESQLSAYHETIHLSINQGIGTTWNLIWNYYEGFTFPSYNIYRGTSSSNMTLLNTIASTLNSYTDLNPPAGYVYYQIEAVNPNPCSPSKSNEYNSTRSNIATNNLTSVNNYIKDKIFINIYPNPASNNINIETNSIAPLMNYDIYDIVGKKVITGVLNSNIAQINVSGLTNGMYFVKLYSDDFSHTQKVIINH